MKKIIPFTKELTFKTNVFEITSVALEHTLHTKEKEIEGELIINGTYKITETSELIDSFEFKIPLSIEIDEKYIVEDITIDINDFYYEIINNCILQVNIEISIDNLTEKIEEKELGREIIKIESQEERCIEEELTEDQIDQIKKREKKTLNIFENIEEQEEYKTYYIYIVREGDSVDSIMAKYNITKETLSEYNDLSEIKLGDKIVIPEKNANN